jgi:hypothetical protein
VAATAKGAVSRAAVILREKRLPVKGPSTTYGSFGYIWFFDQKNISILCLTCTLRVCRIHLRGAEYKNLTPGKTGMDSEKSIRPIEKTNTRGASMAIITHQRCQEGRLRQFPWYRTIVTPPTRSSYCDNSHSQSFDTAEEAIEYAASQKRAFRTVEEIHGESNGGQVWKIKIIAKWGLKIVDGRKVFGRIK